MSKKIIKTLSANEAQLDIPTTPELSIDHLCIGMEKSYSSYMRDGNTEYSSYKMYDFGYGVHNSSDVFMRVSFTLISLAGDEYSRKKYYIWKDIAPGEKTRVWANFRFNSRDAFYSIGITEIGIGKTPTNRNDGATWSNWTNPNKRIGEVIKAPTSIKKVMIIVTIILLSIFVLPKILWFLKSVLF